MTVKELIANLKEYPDDMEVWMYTPEADGISHIDEIDAKWMHDAIVLCSED